MPNVTPFEAEKQRAFNAVQAAVQNLSPTDVVDVLTQQLREVASAIQEPSPQPALLVLRARKRGPLSKVEDDPEVEAFILKQSATRTVEHLLQQCVREFGKERAPSRSGLYRYIDKLKYRTKGDRE